MQMVLKTIANLLALFTLEGIALQAFI